MATANVVNTRVVPAETKVFPYYDDFDESKNFHRILFRPGYAVQARELTQVQTILQNQIERFGRHIFVNGSSVIGGEITFSSVVSLNVSPQYANTDIDVNNFINKRVTYSTNNDVAAEVISATSATETDPPTLYLRYITGSEFNAGDTIKVSGEELYANIVPTANAKSNSYFGFIRDSIFFYDGYFIKVPPQNIIISKYSTVANAKVGLELDQSFITESQDTSLLDPALEASNYQAPGAARYKAELVLAKRNLDTEDTEEFIEISRIENGVLTKNIRTPVYSEIEEVFARRTFDESGNYTVKPFVVTIEEDTLDPANNVIVNLTAGKAYIYGYEYETISPTRIRTPKARTKANVTNYDLITNYGNYVIVDNLQGVFNTSTMSGFDIHCVPHQFISTTNSTAYNSTKIGRGRVKELEFFSGDVSVPDRKHEFYIFDTSFNNIRGNCTSTAPSTYEAILNSSRFSANNNAYQGAVLRVTAGPAAGETKIITSYNGSTKTANVFPASFSTALTSSSNVSIDFDFGEAESFVAHPTFTTGNPVAANCNITTLNKDNGLSNGNAFMFESTLQPLIFKYPQQYIATDSIKNQEFEYRRLFTGVQFSGGVSTALVAGTDENFKGASATSNVAATVTDNFLVICTNNQGGSRANGEQIKVVTSITSGTPEQATLNTEDAGDTFIATIYAKMQASASATNERIKSLVKANTTYFSSSAPDGSFVNPTGSTANVHLSQGQVVITNPSRRPNQKESLFISDVLTVKKIYDLEGAAIPSPGDNITGYKDITSYYIFNDGQKDEYYDHASITLRPGYPAPKGPIIVCCRYFSHTTDKGYFSVDSYPNLNSIVEEEGVNLGTGYTLIPRYKTFELTDSIDFRPVRQNASNTAVNFTLNGIKLPIPATDFKSDYQHYLGRYDIVTLNANKTLSIIQGKPSLFPQKPMAPSKSMVLNTLYFAPYTDTIFDVGIEYMNTKRYTMKDIGNLERRVDNIEYYTSLNTLEKDALDISITDVDGLNRAKLGVFVEGFTGHLLADTSDPDYKIAVDVNGAFTGDGMAIPQYYYGRVPLTLIGFENVAIKFDRVLLDYVEEPFLIQDTATKFTAIADYLYATFEGTVYTSPESDVWRDLATGTQYNITYIYNEFYRRRTTYVPYTEQAALAWAIGEIRRIAVQGLIRPQSGKRYYGDKSILNMSDAQMAAYLKSRGGSGLSWFYNVRWVHNPGTFTLN